MTTKRIPSWARALLSTAVGSTALLCCASARAAPVTVDPGDYDGQWRINGSYVTGETTLDLAPGNHNVGVGSYGAFAISVDSGGSVTVLNGESGVGGPGTLTFNTVDVAVDPAAFDGQWNISRGEPANYDSGIRTATLVPGVWFSVAAGSYGSFVVRTDETGLVEVNNGISALGGDGTLTFNTVDVAVDPAAFDGQWNISRGEPGNFDSGPRTATLVPGVWFSVGTGSYGSFVVRTDETGLVEVNNGVSAVGGTETLTFNTVDVAVDPGEFDGQWNISRGEPGNFDVGPRVATLVPGVWFSFGVGSYGGFIARTDDAGIVEVNNGVSAAGGTGTLTFNTVEAAVDPGSYAGEWTISRGEPGNFDSGPRTATLVPGVWFSFNVGSYGGFIAMADALGYVDVHNDSSATGGLGSLLFNTFTVSVDPGDHPGSWWFSRGSSSATGAGTVELVASIYWTFIAHGEGNQLVYLDDPCALDPGSFSLGAADFELGCGCEDGDLDGICDVEDVCPLDPDNDADGDGVCGELDLCSGDDATGDTDGDGICDDGDFCFGDDATGDTDSDGVCDGGDLCFGDDATGDVDSDGVCDDIDLCLGSDSSGDSDDDGVCDDSDVCPLDPLNDEDGDTVCGDIDTCLGDDQSGDDDGDDICNDLDLCVGNDAVGDEDFDGYCDDLDNCPSDANDQSDQDNDGIGDVCEQDSDLDGVIDDADNCPVVANAGQADIDGDGLGDACDDDDDGDGVSDGLDNCPIHANPAQADFDADGTGDACDGDDDADGISDDIDVCTGTPIDALFDRKGCSGVQNIERICGEATDYERHGRFVSCVVRVSKRQQRKGLITRRERARIIRNAARGRRC